MLSFYIHEFQINKEMSTEIYKLTRKCRVKREENNIGEQQKKNNARR